MPAVAAVTCNESWGAASPCCLTSLPAEFWLCANMAHGIAIGKKYLQSNKFSKLAFTAKDSRYVFYYLE